MVSLSKMRNFSDLSGEKNKYLGTSNFRELKKIKLCRFKLQLQNDWCVRGCCEQKTQFNLRSFIIELFPVPRTIARGPGKSSIEKLKRLNEFSLQSHRNGPTV